MLSLELPAGFSYPLLREQARDLLVAMSVDAMLQLDESSRTIAELEREMDDLRTRARSDALTGLPNRAMLDSFLAHQAHQRMREELPGELGVILIDVDRPRPLQRPARARRRRRRAALDRRCTDERRAAQRSRRAFRRRGFCVVVPHATPQMLADAAERLRHTVEEHVVDLGARGTFAVTASFGCATLAEVTAPGDVVKLLAAAGAALTARSSSGQPRRLARQPLAPH